MLLPCLLFAALCFSETSRTYHQETDQTILGLTIIRQTSRGTTSDLVPLAVCNKGKFRSAEPIANGRVCPLNVGTTFRLYRRGGQVGSMHVSSILRKIGPSQSYRFGEGKWKVVTGMAPSAPARYVAGEQALAAETYIGPNADAKAPARVLLALNARRSPPSTLPVVTPADRREVEAAARPLAVDQANKLGADSSQLREQAFTYFDIDSDKVPEYALTFTAPQSADVTEGIFIVGTMQGSTFSPMYVEQDGDLIQTAFDALDIDGDGKQEIICQTSAMDAGGVTILAKDGDKLKKVFEDVEFGG